MDRGLERNIDTSVQTARTQWQTKQPHLHKGSTIEFAAYRVLALHDIVRADNQTVVLVPRSIGHAVGDVSLTIGLTQPADDYPSSWIQATVEKIDATNAIWAGRAR